MLSKNATKNTIVSLISLGILSLLTFAMRTYIIKYLGVDILGINETIVETVNLLSMSELGIQTSIAYKMYKPIIDNDLERQRQLFNLYKIAYRIVGLIIILLGLLIFPFIPKIVHTSISLRLVYAAYILQVGLMGLSYFYSYYKILFMTYQRQYVYVRFELLVKILGIISQITVIAMTNNYLLYLAINYIALLFNSIFIISKAKREDGIVTLKCTVKRTDVKSLYKDIKPLMVGTIAGYIYSSTDNILISTFFGSITTGFISNYKLVSNLIRSILTTVSSAVSPSWGTYLNTKKNEGDIWEIYNLFIFIEYLFGMFLILPMLLLIDSFIILWLGNSFVIKYSITVFIAFDLLIVCLNEPSCIILKNLGMFQEEKKVSFVAAILNIIISLCSIRVFGIEGIFIGTVCAGVSYW